MSKTRQEKRSKVKPFIKVVNYNHLMPTRYTLELEGLKGVVSTDTFKEVSQREEAKKTVKKVLEERYTSGKNRWFFTALSTSPRLTHFPTHPLYSERRDRWGDASQFQDEPTTNMGRALQDFDHFFLIGWAGRTVVLGCIQHRSA